MTEADRVWSVRISRAEPDGEGRLGPYFSLQSARNQASRASGKGAIVHGIDVATAEWRPEEPCMGFDSDCVPFGPCTNCGLERGVHPKNVEVST